MRTVSEQVAGLGRVAEALTERRILSAIFAPGHVMDTAVLRTETHRGFELVYASGGYDTWTTGAMRLVETDLSLEEAIELMAGQESA